MYLIVEGFVVNNTICLGTLYFAGLSKNIYILLFLFFKSF